MHRRCLLATALAPAVAWAAAPVADVLARPSAAVRLRSKPAMLRIVRAGPRLVAVGERGIVLLSDDDGRQWRQAQVPVSTTLTGVQFIDAQRGWAIGHAAVVLRTLDGGQTWARQFDGRSLPGAADGLAHPLLALHFSDDQNGWAVGAYGLALHTRDGGATWAVRDDRLPNPKGLHLYALAPQGDTLFMAGEQGLLLSVASNAQAGSGVALSAPYRGSFFALLALPAGQLLLAGLRGTLLLRAPDGSFRHLASGTTQAIVSASVLGDQRLALVDQSGRVQVGTPAGTGFNAWPAETEKRWVAVTSARDGSLVGAGATGVARLAPAPGVAQ